MAQYCLEDRSWIVYDQTHQKLSENSVLDVHYRKLSRTSGTVYISEALFYVLGTTWITWRFRR
jgi:hypothetical protein